MRNKEDVEDIYKEKLTEQELDLYLKLDQSKIEEY